MTRAEIERYCLARGKKSVPPMIVGAGIPVS
jgi:hypothetical protein